MTLNNKNKYELNKIGSKASVLNDHLFLNK